MAFLKRLRKIKSVDSDETDTSIEKQIFHLIDRASSKNHVVEAQISPKANYAGLHPLLIESKSFPRGNPLYNKKKEDVKLRSYYYSGSMNGNNDFSFPYHKRRSAELSWDNRRPLFFHKTFEIKKAVSTGDLNSLQDNFNHNSSYQNEDLSNQNDFVLSSNPNVSFRKSNTNKIFPLGKQLSLSLTTLDDKKVLKAKKTPYRSMPLFALNGDSVEDIDKVLNTTWPTSSLHKNISTDVESSSSNNVEKTINKNDFNDLDNLSNENNITIDEKCNETLSQNNFNTFNNESEFKLISLQDKNSNYQQDNDLLESNNQSNNIMKSLLSNENEEKHNIPVTPSMKNKGPKIVIKENKDFSLKELSRYVPLTFFSEQKSREFFGSFSSFSNVDAEQKNPVNLKTLLEEHSTREKNVVDAYLNNEELEESEEYCVTESNQRDIIDFLFELTGDSVYPDKACKRTVLAFKVRCYNFGNDCEWIGELGNLQDHLEQCQLIEVACVNACGRKDIHRNQMSQHTDADGDCPLAIVACRYSDVGCKFKARRNELEDHLRESIEEHLKFAHMRIRELEIRQETICMNGKFLWKITNYDLLMKQSATKKDKEKLCSPPFYTGQYGYKLRAEAFLNGLGQGKGSHLSLYVVIMKGEYDAILPWPFRQNVDFVLIDQDEEVNNRVNKIWKLSCERNSDYFKRPNKSKSLGFGCPKFVSLETLKSRNYIKEQTLFIKIEVEPTDCLVFNPVGFVH